MSRILALLLFCVSIPAFSSDLKITSQVIQDGEMIKMDQVFNSFGCSGKNISPDLKWEGAPEGTKFFAVTMYDPDAPTGNGWWHWTVFNIPAKVTSIPANASKKSGKLGHGAVQGRTDFGKAGYGGPCPPPGHGKHHYVIKVFALKDKLPLKSDSPAAQVGFYANSLKLAEGKLEAIYERN